MGRWLLISMLFATGCEAQRSVETAAGTQRPVERLVDGSNPMLADSQLYHQAPCSALVFDPPILAGTPQIDFNRSDRRGGAFIGFDTLTTTYSDVYFDDDQRIDDRFNRFQRRALSERVGVLTR